MSGIAGILRFDGQPAETAVVESMIATMARRGPDGIGRWSGGSVALSHLMLHTTPESLSERQPLVSADGQRVLVVHGRIDNRDELAEALAHRRVAPLDGSDAALFLAAYEAWGDDFPERIEGDFALVLWDARRQAAVCARDRVGAKPFVWHWDGRRFSFASEVRAVLDLPWVENIPDESAIIQLVVHDLRSAANTFWRGVRRLAPGRRMVVTADGPESALYWRLDLGRRLRYRRTEEYVEHYRDLLHEIVRRMSRSHRPLAFDVSGGLDSSGLFAAADRLERDGRLLAPGFAGYTLRFNEHSPANDLSYARGVAAHLGRPVNEIEPSSAPLAWYEAEARASGEFPGSPNGEMERALRRAAAAAGSRAVFRGTAGDEVLGGARERYAETIARGEVASLPGMLSEEWRDRGLALALRTFLLGGMLPLLPASARGSLRRWSGRRSQADDIAEWTSPRGKAALQSARPAQELPLTGTLFDDHRGLLRVVLRPIFANTLETAERHAAGMVEFRDPFCNAGMLAFSASVPERLLAAGTLTRRLHRLAFRDALPQSVIERKGKADFSSVFRPVFAEIEARMSRGLPVGSGLLDEDTVKEHLARVAESFYISPHIWQIWMDVACTPLFDRNEMRRRLSPEQSSLEVEPNL